MKSKKLYVSPQINMITFKAERGYVSSGSFLGRIEEEWDQIFFESSSQSHGQASRFDNGSDWTSQGEWF